MARTRKKLKSDMGWSNESSITVQGLDLTNDILGKFNLGDFAFLEIKGRAPTPEESLVFNAMLGALVEHGMTPMVIAARLTYLGAPESLQGAVAAGILGMGTTFAGTAEGSARLLQEAIKADTTMADLPALAEEIVAPQFEHSIRAQSQRVARAGFDLRDAARQRLHHGWRAGVIGRRTPELAQAVLAPAVDRTGT